MTSPADMPLSPRAVQNVARLRNLNVRIDPAAGEPIWRDMLTPRLKQAWFPRKPK